MTPADRMLQHAEALMASARKIREIAKRIRENIRA